MLTQLTTSEALVQTVREFAQKEVPHTKEWDENRFQPNTRRWRTSLLGVGIPKLWFGF